ncbi:MAG: hypothetical protein IPM51_02975 [Sphingobacteriaceae bacterium]|nr:hypothetical protein [Sphingobacteriaceae bacterium]
MAIDELLDDEALNPKELFDSSKFLTLVINRDGFSKKQNDSADLIEKLLDNEVTREELDQIYKSIKELGNVTMLIESINTVKSKEQKAKLVAAVWESGLDASNYFLLFTKLACENDFAIAMEALTVVQNIETKIDSKILTQGMQLAQESTSPNKELIDDLINCLKEKAVQTID